ncbi:MAG: L-threonylcarbamoyladenylate synthase [Cryomorphaceae bacterium]|nr:Sua5/YciO/YrdC/YwlC family protein [Flavobacteriales bacterium]
MKSVDSKTATQLLRDGEVIIAALDDMLGLICDARNDEAVALLRKLKNRGADKGFSILIDSDARLNKYVSDIPPIAWDIIDTATTPLILILPKGKNLSPAALASDGTVAVRMVSNREEQKLVQTANSPLACTALLTDEGVPAARYEDAAPAVLEAVQYVLSLPTAKRTYPPEKIPVIKLGTDGEVEIVRE